MMAGLTFLVLIAATALAHAPGDGLPGGLSPWEPEGAAIPGPVNRIPAPAAAAAGQGAPSRANSSPEDPARLRRPFFRCSAGAQPCTRSHPARLVLGFTGLLVGAAGATYLLLLGDRLGAGDPGAAFVGGGTLMLSGALLGGVAGLVDGDRRNHPDRVRQETIGLTYDFGQRPILGEVHPGAMHARWAPGWYFPRDLGRLRFTGYAGGLVGREVNVDPRPQAAVFPALPGVRRTSFGFGLDLAVALPYPLLGASRTSWLGPAEIRLRPEVHVQRELYGDGSDAPRLISRTMLLPLTVGLRWHLAARQRFTAYLGPRFDLVAFSATGAPPLRRGPAQLGSLHVEAWYDLDIPFTLRPVDGRGRSRRAAVNSTVSLGYVHSRFNGTALNIGPTSGYLGHVHAAYRVRVRPKDALYALQVGAGASVGRTLGVFLELGVALPDLGTDPRGREARRAF